MQFKPTQLSCATPHFNTSLMVMPLPSRNWKSPFGDESYKFYYFDAFLIPLLKFYHLGHK